MDGDMHKYVCGINNFKLFSYVNEVICMAKLFDSPILLLDG